MLAERAKRMPEGEGWVYERKLDGLRCIAVRNGDEVELWSRGHLSFTERFARIADELRELPIDNFVLDGEIVAIVDGRTSFAALQRPGSTAEPIFYAFDLLHLLGQDTAGLPLVERKTLLKTGLEETERVRLTDYVRGDPAELLEQACASGWEGLMAKRADGPYVSGRASQWLKLKCTASQELVIGGWTEPRGARSGFGALLVGYFDDQGFRYAGKVGTGFDTETLRTMYESMARNERPESPFVDQIREKTAHWTEPTLVANIAFTEWTTDGKLRHPRFEGLRPDKDAHSVTREA
jgi:bifunctional non-homologous end joining protein LigD